jgi:hypothetical protein
MAAIVALAASLSALPRAHSQESTIADSDSFLIDGKAFTITRGKANSDVRGLIRESGARPLEPSVVIFRSGEKLYIVDSPPALGRNAEVERPNRVRIEYEPPKNPDHQKLYDMIRDNGVLETVQQIFSPFRLPTELTIKTMGCDGMVNAWYSTDAGKPTVHMCYELLQSILQNVPEETTPAGVTPRDAVVGQFFVWTVHEIGHAMYAMYKSPMYGHKEDAADQFAAFMMLQFGKDKARRLVGGAAYAFHDAMKTFDPASPVQKQLGRYSEVHSLPEQRFYNLVCFAYGADPKTFADVVEKGYLPERRGPSCESDFQAYKSSFERDMLPHIDRRMARQVLDTTWLPPAAPPQPE